MAMDPAPGTPGASSAELQAASELLRALAAPVRLGIVRELADGHRRVHELVAALGVSQPLVSQHLRLLRAARIVTAHRKSREIEYSLTDEHVAHIVLDAIRHAAEA
ncbi:metalloregulator ArsR/SmtB family transcription factor [Kitasatospora sp. GAS204B]|uniref:ArsR/SmtB family transcription factor n=1 Tax=unclassified Kitasatospora TaxID=2633591 RepID=UPI002473AA44|nr:metalloregulator ArsR/SmtB family transcription factor [Kitasatospora sp. GAS204B]